MLAGRRSRLGAAGTSTFVEVCRRELQAVFGYGCGCDESEVSSLGAAVVGVVAALLGVAAVAAAGLVACLGRCTQPGRRA